MQSSDRSVNEKVESTQREAEQAMQNLNPTEGKFLIRNILNYFCSVQLEMGALGMDSYCNMHKPLSINILITV